MFAEIILPLLKLFPWDYKLTEKVEVGDLVVVNFRNKKITGIVWRLKESTDCAKVKDIEHKLNYKVSTEFVAFLKKAADYYLTSYGSIAKLTLPIEIFNCKLKSSGYNNYNYNINLAALSGAQEKAFVEIQKAQFTLLQGVTGSGKTEVYFHLAKEMVDAGKQVLILMPEIALTNQMITRFEKRFGFKPAIWTSSEKLSYKKQIFHDVLDGKVKILIGARSASFLPFPNLGLIIIDDVLHKGVKIAILEFIEKYKNYRRIIINDNNEFVEEKDVYIKNSTKKSFTNPNTMYCFQKISKK
jgi:primosomal protein N' (replication factor Y)